MLEFQPRSPSIWRKKDSFIVGFKSHQKGTGGREAAYWKLEVGAVLDHHTER